MKSLPTRGGWIEIRCIVAVPLRPGGPSPHGEGGLKFVSAAVLYLMPHRPSPHGEGGLKSGTIM